MFTYPVIRRLRREDIPAITAVHVEQFPRARSTRLGKAFVRQMYHWFLREQPGLAFVATLDDVAVGFAVGAIGGYGRQILRSAIPQIAWGLLSNPRLILQPGMLVGWRSYARGLLPQSGRQPRALAVTAVSSLASIGPHEPKAGVKASLASIAVASSAQGCGIGKALLVAFEQAARAEGADRLGLSVESGNVAARRLYESCNWTMTSEDRDSASVYYTKFIEWSLTPSEGRSYRGHNAQPA